MDTYIKFQNRLFQQVSGSIILWMLVDMISPTNSTRAIYIAAMGDHDS